MKRPPKPPSPAVCDALADAGVEVRGDAATRHLWPRAAAASEGDWDEEYLSLIVSVKVVPDVDAAVRHINGYGSRHTDGIITHDTRLADRFISGVDSASVTVNASTRFADGGEYGLGGGDRHQH